MNKCSISGKGVGIQTAGENIIENGNKLTVTQYQPGKQKENIGLGTVMI